MAYARAGNWCPGGLVETDQYKLPGVTAGSAHTVDVDFDDSYNGVGAYGSYNIASSVVYYGPYSRGLDASLEDIAAPTNFEWYRRENPRAGTPIIKVRNTGSNTITSILFHYGVKDSSLSQYIWTGSLSSSQDTLITLPPLSALTNLSLEYATGLQSFAAEIVRVNGALDEDGSNNTLTSSFAVAPSWPANIAINMLTSSIDVNGNPGSSSPSLSDASWQISDANSRVVASRSGAVVKTHYRDTIDLTAGGFYKLEVSTSQCMGLHWWVFELAAPDNTPGYSAGTFGVWDVNAPAILPMNGNNTGQYHDDFGCGFTQYFTTIGECQTDVPVITRRGDTLYATPANGYQWYYNGHLIAGATQSSYGIQHNNGNYTVYADYGNSCTATSASYAVVNLGANDLSDLSSVIISPNPATDAFTIGVNIELVDAAYTLTDLSGRDVLTGKLATEVTKVLVTDMAPGMYLLHIGKQNGHSFKVIRK